MRTVFHVSSSSADNRERAMRNVVNLLRDGTVYDEDDAVAVVANGDGVRMFVAGTAAAPDRVEQLRAAGVELYACANTLERTDVDEADLLPGVETVPSGVGALARLQDEGYGYVKVP